MQERLVRVETKLDILIADIAPRHSDHETRIRATETAVAEIRTRIALIAGGTGTAGGIVTAVLAHFIGAP